MTNNNGQKEHLLAISLEPVELRQEFSQYPPHITIWSPLHAVQDETIPYINQRMGEVAKDWLPFNLGGGGVDYFGPNKDRPVQRLFSMQLPALHAGALCMTEALGLDYDDTYLIKNRGMVKTGLTSADPYKRYSVDIKEDYHPHVSNFQRIIEEGQTIKVESFQFFVSMNGIKRVISVFSNQGCQSEYEIAPR